MYHIGNLFCRILLGELYLFKTYSNSIHIIAAGMAVLLILTYFLSSNLIALHNEWMEEKSANQQELLNKLITELSNHKEDRTQETLANVEKFEKAIYLAVQQHTTKMQESLSQLDQGFAGDFDRLSNLLEETGKSITKQIETTGDHNDKVYVKFSRENTKSLMMFQKKAFDNVMLGMEETVQEYTQTAQKMQAKLDELKQTLTHASLQTPPAADINLTATEDDIISDLPVENTISEEQVMTEETVSDISMEDSVLETTLPDMEETVTEEIPIVEEAPIIEEPSPVNDDPNHVMTPEEIAALVAGSSTPAAEETPVVEEPSPVNDDPNHIMTPEEIAALIAGSSEPVAEETPVIEEPSPVNDDPNHIMTPEEIAALVADSSTPAAEETPVVEEPSPVNDDPNHVMTPEEIAALIAGTQQ